MQIEQQHEESQPSKACSTPAKKKTKKLTKKQTKQRKKKKKKAVGTDPEGTDMMKILTLTKRLNKMQKLQKKTRIQLQLYPRGIDKDKLDNRLNALRNLE